MQSVIECGGKFNCFVAQELSADSVAAALGGELDAIAQAVRGSDGFHAGDIGGDGFKAAFPEQSRSRPAKGAILHDYLFNAEQGPDGSEEQHQAHAYEGY